MPPRNQDQEHRIMIQRSVFFEFVAAKVKENLRNLHGFFRLSAHSFFI